MPEWESDANFKTAELVHEQVLMLWEDQVALAETLVEKRKTLSQMLAILVGLGIFRLQFYKRSDEILVVSGNALNCVRWNLVAAMFAFAIGGYFLYTQRPNCRRFALWAWDSVKRLGMMLFRKARAKTQDEAHGVKMPPPAASKWPNGRAIRALLTPEDSLDDWHSMTPLKALEKRTERLREAYSSLQKQNERVSLRLRDALILLFIGYGLVFVALGMYIWSI